MKLLKLSIIGLALGLMSFNAKPVTTTLSTSTLLNTSASTISWKSEELDLGNIPQGKPVAVNFEFKNTGTTPVFIESVQASCGCTATDYSKMPVLPGESTKIAATYNAAAMGVFKKTITVKTNAEELPRILVIKGVVI